VLDDIATDGSPANTVYEFLRGFYKAKGSLVFKQIKFDLNEGTDGHAAKIKRVVKSLDQ
jgi:hypothetical protein